MRLGLHCAIIAAGVCAAAAPTAAREPPRVRLSGHMRTLEMCGRARPAVRAADGARVVVRSPLRARRLRVDRCESGRWVATGALRSRTLDTSRDGDLRIRARGARAAYLRVGVGEIVDAPLRFEVRNVNRSQVPCLTGTDAKTYAIAGRLVAPRAALSGPARPGAALYLHGIEVTGGYFHLPVPGYDHVYEMARLGHVSVVIDRLGYGASGRPPGTMTCTGAQADVAHQVAEELRSGAYEMTGGGAPPRFERVALVGHSGGAIAAQVAMYSFGDFAAGIVMGFHDQLPGSTIATEGLTGEAPRCAAGGVPADGDSGPPGYAYLFTSTAAWSHATMADGTPEVLAALAPLRRRTPCGELETDLLVSPFDNLHLGAVHIPVLLLYGERDLLFPYSGAPAQRGHYTGTRDVTFVGFPGGGHQFFLDRGVASQVRAVMSRWLSIRGF